MSTVETRPLRTLAAWGYQSDTTGTRVEIDVWTVNQTTRDRDDALERAREVFADNGRIESVIDAAGSTAKVNYAGAAGVGYRYIDGGKATQQAYAGAKRSAGGSRTDAGTFEEGWTVPPDAPDLDACVAHGRGVVIPAVRRDLRESGARELAQAIERIKREPRRDEEEEPTTDRPFNGFRNAVRIYPRNGREFEYSVDTNRDNLKRS
jgi:hypothetical protein